MSPVLLDSDTLSELSRGQQAVVRKTKAYLEKNGRLTISAITVFERLRGYRDAIREANRSKYNCGSSNCSLRRVSSCPSMKWLQTRPRLFGPGSLQNIEQGWAIF